MNPLMKLFRRGMSCEDVLVVLQAYIDGEVEEDVARQVIGHLDRCDHCERESAVYVRIKQSLHTHQHPIDPQVMTALTRFGERVARGELT